MQKWLLAAGAFVVGATLGMGVLAASIAVMGFVAVRRSQGGIGMYSVGIGHWTVLVVPVVCGALLAWAALRRLNRIEQEQKPQR